MNKKGIVLLGLLGLIIIFFMCVLLHLRAIEEDVAACSKKILANANYTRLSLDTHDRGRSVLISGELDSAEEKDKVLALLHNQCNITKIENNLKVNITVVDTSVMPFLSLKIDAGKAILNGKVSDSSQAIQILNLFNPKTVKHNIKIDKNAYYADFAKDISISLPEFKRISAVEIKFEPSKITLNGKVKSQQIKETIALRLSNLLTHNIKVINNLKNIGQTTNSELYAASCQTKLNKLLSQSKINFKSASAVINNNSMNLLKELSKTVKSCQNVKITIIGHTDKSGNEIKNIKLSKLRALAVVKFLLNSGIKLEKFTARGVGSSEQITTNKTPQGRATNRRIEFKVQSIKE